MERPLGEWSESHMVDESERSSAELHSGLVIGSVAGNNQYAPERSGGEGLGRVNSGGCGEIHPDGVLFWEVM